jgi:4-hydroxybenzoate polyprenyltransferase
MLILHNARSDVPVNLARRTASAFAMCVVEARPTVLGIFLLRFLTGCVLVAGPSGSPRRVVAGAVLWELAILSVYVLNGTMDVHEDRVNASRRPIAGGALSPRTAGRVAWGAAAVSVCGSTALGSRFTGAVVAVLVVGYLYSAPPLYLKRRAVGTSAVGALLGLLSYMAGHFANAGSPAGGALPVFAIVMSLWMALVGAPTKDLPDVVGDAAAGRRTLAVLVEESKLRVVVSATALGLAAALLAAGTLTPVLLAPGLALLIGAAATTFLCLSRGTRHGRDRRRRPYKAFMATQYLAHLAALVAVHAWFFGVP